jgi:hypothetical protein
MKLTKEQLLGIVRHALTFIGGIVMKGLVDEAACNRNYWWCNDFNWCYLVYY